MKFSAPIIGIARHRLATDGKGVTTLVVFHGCPLRCKYCINPQSLSHEGRCERITPEQLIEQVSVDHIYFAATDGGITFGGGEPLLRTEFIHKFCQLCPNEWNIALETSLNVPLDNVKALAPLIREWIVDIKETNPDTYEAYTKCSNEQVTENLRWFAEQEKYRDRVTIRLPLIPKYNSPTDIEQSEHKLRELGFTKFDKFKYKVRQLERR